MVETCELLSSGRYEEGDRSEASLLPIVISVRVSFSIIAGSLAKIARRRVTNFGVALDCTATERSLSISSSSRRLANQCRCDRERLCKHGRNGSTGLDSKGRFYRETFWFLVGNIPKS